RRTVDVLRAATPSPGNVTLRISPTFVRLDPSVQVLRPGDPLPTVILIRCTSVLPPGNLTSKVRASTPTKSARERYTATNAGTSSAKHCLLLVAVTVAFLTVTLPFSGGDVSWIDGSGPAVQSGRTLIYTPTRISVLCCPLAVRLTLCT